MHEVRVIPGDVVNALAYYLTGVICGAAGLWLVAELAEALQARRARRRRRWMNNGRGR